MRITTLRKYTRNANPTLLTAASKGYLYVEVEFKVQGPGVLTLFIHSQVVSHHVVVPHTWVSAWLALFGRCIGIRVSHWVDGRQEKY